MGKRKNTISLSVTRGILLFLIPVNILLSVYALFSWSFLRSQALENYTRSLTMTTQQVDSELNSLSNWLQNLFYADTAFQLMQTSSDKNATFITAQEVNQSVQPYLQMYSNDMVFFIHCGENLHIPAVSTMSTNHYNVILSDFIQSIASTAEQHPMGEYFPIQLGDKWFLAIYLQMRNVYTGVILDMEELLSLVDLSGSSIQAYGFEDLDGTPLTSELEGTPKGTPLTISLEHAPLAFRAFIPESAILGGFTLLNALSAILTVAALGLVIAFIAYTRRQVAAPLEKLQQTIHRIEAGHTEEKIDVSEEKEDVAEVYRTFNAFIDHIMQLKLESYEERIARQKTELQYLRLQLRPHFFLNSMKRLYALAQQRQMDDVQEYILCLSSHYRFLIYDTTNTISLQEEMRHVENYIQLQRIGYHLEIHCRVSMEVNPSLLQVPPLVVQSFVENSIKHAVVPGRPLELSLAAKAMDGEEGPYLTITCQDNGPGFSAQVLEDINLGKEEFSKKHVGFNNLKHRLALIYQRESFIYVYNLPEGGAAVEIMLPIEKPTIKEENAKELLQ